MSDVISENIQHFLLENIDSIAQWEALLLLQKKPDEEWSVERVANALYISTEEASSLLAQLVRRKILSIAGNKDCVLYQYHPESPELDQLIRQGAGLYSKYLIPITHLIHSKPKNRIQKFADAFKLRKD